MNAQQLKNSILQEAIEGRLVPQDPNDEPASILLDKIRKEKVKLVKEGKLKKKDLIETPIEEDEIPFKIPESWEWCKITSLLLLLTDGTHNSPPSYNQGDYKYITAKNIKSEGIDLTNVTFVSKEVHDVIYSRCNPEYGDILYIKDGATSGIVTINNLKEPFSLLSSVALLKQSRVVDGKYLLSYLRSPYCYNMVRASMKGAAITRITLRMIQEWLVPLPPLAEQKRIVEKIEELLPKVDEYGKAQASLDKLNKEMPERLKKSILQEAIEGRLVPQDPNEEPASVLLDKIRKEKAKLVKEGKLKKKDLEEFPVSEDEKPFEIPKNWIWCKLGTIAVVLGGKRIPAGRKLSIEKTGHIYIRVSDMKENTVSTDNLQYVPEDIYPSISKYIIKKEDVYITVAGTIGRVGKIPFELDGANLTENADRLVFSHINQDWLIKCLQSNIVQTQITDVTTKVGQPKLAILRIQSLLIPLPPLAEQKRIVAKIEQLLHEIDKLKV